MIQVQTLLRVADNSGAKTVRCIKVLGGFKRKYAKLGDIIVVSIQDLRNKSKDASKVRKREIYRSLIIRTKIESQKENGLRTLFNQNAVVLITKQGSPVGTRVIGPLPQCLNQKKFQKFIDISVGLI